MGVLIQIDERSKKPIFRQIMDQIIWLVETEALTHGARLPSTRLMAEQLAVNRSTVYKAYQELWSLGYLESTPGSYSTIRKRAKVVSEQRSSKPSLIDWQKRVTRSSRALYIAHRKESVHYQPPTESDVINFVPLSPDSRLFPVDAFRKCMNHVLAVKGVDLLQYGSPLGYLPLRRYIAARMRAHCVAISADEIMITTGAQNAIELLLKMMTRPGSGVVFETPTYSRALDIFRLNNVNMINVSMDTDGMNLDTLEDVLCGTTPAMIYTIPNFHNPTGITTSQHHRERLLSICERHAIPLVEDGFEEEMKYFGKAVLPIKSMDHRSVVIYLGTFSKILFPGLRIGWIAAHKSCINRLAPIQKAMILSGNLLDQAALDYFCRTGHYDRHIKRMHRTYRRRMQTAFKAMQATFDNHRIAWTQPAGGYTLWVRLKGLSLSEDDIAEYLVGHGVKVLPGNSHFYGPANGVYFRLSIAHLDESAIEEGINRIGNGLTQLYRKRRDKLWKKKP